MARRPAAAAPHAALGPATRVALLVGPELFLHVEHTARLREALAAAHGGVEVARFDGTTARAADILDECRTFGLLQRHKLVVVDQADQAVKEDARPLFERYAEQPSEQATLVLRAEKWNKGRLDALIEQAGAIVRCDTLAPEHAAAWAVQRCTKRHGATLEPDAAAALVERLGPDLGRIDSELAKLAASAGAPPVTGGRGGAADRPVITPELVAELVGRTHEEEAWAIQAPLLEGDAPEALRRIHEALTISRHPPELVSWACLDAARKLHGASRGLATGVRGFELIRRLQLWGSGGDAVLRAAARTTPAEASRVLAHAVESVWRTRTGLGTIERALDVLAVRFSRRS